MSIDKRLKFLSHGLIIWGISLVSFPASSFESNYLIPQRDSGPAITTSRLKESYKPYYIKAKESKSFLIAASSQLNNLLYNLTYSVTSIARYYRVQGENYEDAYFKAYLTFYNIIGNNSPSYTWTTQAGAIYTANLIGGGTTNLRDYGSSVPLMPTIDILNHNTPPLGSQPFSQVREIKFPYKTQNNYCPASTLSTC
jgi:hypothetical protein